jgi:hypothetical protein
VIGSHLNRRIGFASCADSSQMAPARSSRQGHFLCQTAVFTSRGIGLSPTGSNVATTPQPLSVLQRRSHFQTSPLWPHGGPWSIGQLPLTSQLRITLVRAGVEAISVQVKTRSCYGWDQAQQEGRRVRGGEESWPKTKAAKKFKAARGEVSRRCTRVLHCSSGSPSLITSFARSVLWSRYQRPGGSKPPSVTDVGGDILSYGGC